MKRFKRKVVRRYKLKSGKTVTKTYYYNQYNVNGRTKSRSEKNIVWRGKLTKYGEKWQKEYNKHLSIDEKSELQDYINDAIHDKKTMTSTKLKSKLSENQVERYIYNMGGDIDDLAEDFGVDRGEIIDAENWDFDESILTIDGRKFQFKFDYKSHSIIYSEVF